MYLYMFKYNVANAMLMLAWIEEGFVFDHKHYC